MLSLSVLIRSLGASSIWPPAIVASVVACFVTTSYFMTARGPWHAPRMLPSDATPRPLHPTSCSQTAHVATSGLPFIAGVKDTLMMSPALVSPWTKFEKKNAFWLAIQLGPSLYP